MAMQQAISWVFRKKVNRNGLKRHNVYDVLDKAADLLFANRSHFEAVPMQMQRMLIGTVILKKEPVAFSFFDHNRLIVGPGTSVDRPGVKLRSLLHAKVGERKRNYLVGGWRWS